MRLRVMTEQDIPGGLRLNTLSGWNQTAADWHRFLESSPAGCFVVEHDAKIVGTATTIVYESRFAWIGMVLVDPEYRKQGIGTRLLHQAIQHLDDASVPTMKLDATPLGKPLYTKLGFVTEYEIERWLLKRPPNARPVSHPSTNLSMQATEIEQLLRGDRELFGADRSFLLHSLRAEAPEFALVVRQDGAPESFAFGRRGRFADHLGPWMAANRAAAEKILHEFLARSSSDTLIVDYLTSNPFAADLLAGCGFAPSRPLTRMVRGPNAYPGRPDAFCAILGPEFG